MALMMRAVHEAPTPSTPRAIKRRRLDRHSSDEKENDVSLAQYLQEQHHREVAIDNKLAVNKDPHWFAANKPVVLGDVSMCTIGKARSPLQPLQVQAQPCHGLVTSPNVPLESRVEEYPLVGREEECGELDRFFEQSLNNGPGKGRCLYISGGPGTGKTCSVRASINKWKSFAPNTCVLEVNCMDLTQRSVTGVFQQLLLKMNRSRAAGRSMQGLATLTASQLAEISDRVVIVVDEVDQLVSRNSSKAAAGALSLETLFSLPRLPGAPAVAIVAIANAVDLLERTPMFSPSLSCSTLLFQPYSKDQLKSIVTSRVKAVKGGDAALKALGTTKVQLRVTQVAKESGDCRQVMSLIEEALFEAKNMSEATRDLVLPPALGSPARRRMPMAVEPSSLPAAPESCSSDADAPRLPKRDPRALIQSNRNDPLQAIRTLPLEQQILLATLATSKHEATKLSDICKRYKELCRDLKQPENLGSRGQVASALTGLENRGLLAMHTGRGATRGRPGKQPPMPTETTVELWVACDELLKSVLRAKPELKLFLKAQ